MGESCGEASLFLGLSVGVVWPERSMTNKGCGDIGHDDQNSIYGLPKHRVDIQGSRRQVQPPKLPRNTFGPPNVSQQQPQKAD